MPLCPKKPKRQKLLAHPLFETAKITVIAFSHDRLSKIC